MGGKIGGESNTITAPPPVGGLGWLKLGCLGWAKLGCLGWLKLGCLGWSKLGCLGWLKLGVSQLDDAAFYPPFFAGCLPSRIPVLGGFVSISLSVHVATRAR